MNFLKRLFVREVKTYAAPATEAELRPASRHHDYFGTDCVCEDPIRAEWDQRYESAFAEANTYIDPIVSPWVKRNEDCAQYAQPRGSQYEG